MYRLMIYVTIAVIVCVLACGCMDPEQRRDLYYQKGLELFDKEEYKLADVELRNAVSIDPDFANGYLLLGRIHFYQQNWHSSYRALLKAAELDASLKDGHLYLARIYHMGGEYGRSGESARNLLELDPDNFEAKIILSTAHVRKGELDEGKITLEGLLNSNPEREEIYILLSQIFSEQGKFSEGLAVLRSGLEYAPESLALKKAKADIYIKDHNYARAEEVYREMIASDSDNISINLVLIQFFQQTGQKDAAKSELIKINNEYPDDKRPYLALAALYVNDARPSEAVDILEKGKNILNDDYDIGLTLADAYLLMEETGKAEQLLHQMIAEAPEHHRVIDARKYLAEIYLQSDRADKSKEQIDLALRLDSRDIDARFLQSRIFIHNNDPVPAIEALRRIIRARPECLNARLLLAQAHFQNREPMAAVENLRSIFTIDPEFAPARKELAAYYFSNKDYSRAMRELNRIPLNDQPDPEVLILKGDIYIHTGEPDMARNEYQQLLKINGGSIIGNYKLGVLAALQREFKKAHLFFEQALQENPQQFKILEAKVMAYLSQNKHNEAMVFIENKIKEFPDNAELFVLMGNLLSNFEQQAKAMDMYSKAIELEPDWKAPYLRMASLYAEAGDLNNGISTLNTALEFHPECPEVHFMLGSLYQHAGVMYEAEKFYAKVLSMDPDYWPAANNLAFIYANYEEDEEKLAVALELAINAAESNHPLALDTLGWTYYRLGDLEMALAKLTQASQVDPENLEIAYHLAVVLAETGDGKKALNILEESMSTHVSDGETMGKIIKLYNELSKDSTMYVQE